MGHPLGAGRGRLGGVAVPILPIIDLLILLGTGSLLVGGVLKFVAITTRYDPAIFSFSSKDFVVIAGVFLGFALVLAARSWVKLNEHKILASQMWPRSLPELPDDELFEPLPAAGSSAQGDPALPIAKAAGAERR